MNSPGQSSSSDSPHPKVLCIDQDPDTSLTLRMRLAPYGVDLLRAFHEMQGFWLALTERPDVIIVDMGIPGEQWDYIVECLVGNSDTGDIPVVVLTSQQDRSTPKRLTGLGVAEFLVKPVDFEALCGTLGRFIPISTSAPALMI